MAKDTISHDEMTEIWFLGYVIHSHEFMGNVQEGYYFRQINASSGDIYGGKTQREAYEACKQYASQQSVQSDKCPSCCGSGCDVTLGKVGTCNTCSGTGIRR